MAEKDSKPVWEEGIGVQERPKTRKPQMYQVLLHNDDYTSMEFVVHILTTVFRHSRTMATQIMLHVHTRGVGLCGVYPYDMAQTKVARVAKSAEEAEMPLRCTMEAK